MRNGSLVETTAVASKRMTAVGYAKPWKSPPQFVAEGSIKSDHGGAVLSL
jgi:hypothetical protein